MRKHNRSRSWLPERPLTALEVGLILGVVALVVFCCLGWAVLAVFAPAQG
jgi:hypothetical protein